MMPSLGRKGPNSASVTFSALIFSALIFGGAVVLRIALMIWQKNDLSMDPDAYRRLAEAWAQSGTFGLIDDQGISHPTAFRPPLYPWLLRWFIVDGALRLEWVAISHVFLAIVSALLVAAIARKMGIGRGLSVVVATLSLLDPIAIRQSSLVMTETLATTLGLIAWYGWIRTAHYWPDSSENSADRVRQVTWLLGSIAVGLALGLSALCRPTALPWLAMWALGVVVSGAYSWRHRWMWTLVVMATLALCLTPWVMRNQRQLGHPIAMTTHGGYTLLLANNEILYDHFQVDGPSRAWEEDAFHRYWEGLQSQALDRSEYDLDRMANDRAEQVIRQRPGEFLRSCFYRLGWFWAWWPAPGNGGHVPRILIGVWYAVWTSVAGWSALQIWFVRRSSNRQMRWLLLPAISLILSLSAVHSVYWSNMRMRAPIMPALYLLAVLPISTRWHGIPIAGQTESDREA